MKAWQFGSDEIIAEQSRDAQDNEPQIDLDELCSACKDSPRLKRLQCRFCAGTQSQAVANGLPITVYNALIAEREYAADAAKGYR